MNRLVLTAINGVVLLFFTDFCLAQDYDLIVTTKGDSIACKVDSISRDAYYILVRMDGKKISTTIPMDQVSEFIPDAIEKNSINRIPGTIYFLSDNNTVRPNAISLSLLGSSPFIGLVIERLLGRKSGFEIGIGYTSFGAGLKLYPQGSQTRKALFHAGITASYVPIPGDINGVIYIPLGVSYFSKNHFSFAFDIGPSLLFFDHGEVFPFPFGNLKLGYRF
jgi:hypothetical protein